MPWQRILALDHFEDRGIFAGDVIMRRGDHFNVQVETATQEVVTPIAGGLSFRQSVCDAFRCCLIIGVDVEVGLSGADRVGGENRSFDDQVRKILH